MADSGESTATFGCRSDSTTAGACPAAEADVSISDIEVAPEMNTDPENESGVKTNVTGGRLKGIRSKQGPPRWIPKLDVTNVAIPSTPKPSSHPNASGSTATGSGNVNRVVNEVRALSVSNNIGTEACTSGMDVGKRESGSTAVPTVRDDQESIRGNLKSTSDAIKARADINEVAWRRGALSGQLGLLALQVSTGGAWFPDKNTCDTITLCSKGCWHFLALRYQLAVRQARARQQAERDIQQSTTAGAAASSSSAASAEPSHDLTRPMGTSGNASGSVIARVPPTCTCCGRTTCSRPWVGNSRSHFVNDWTDADIIKWREQIRRDHEAVARIALVAIGR